MPALPAVPKVVRFNLNYTNGIDTNVLNRVFFEYSGSAPTNAQLSTTCATAMTQWGTHMAALYHPDVILTSVSAEDLTSNTASVGQASGTQEGTRAGTYLSAAACAIVKQEIARRYRGGHPRIYLQAGTQSDTSDAQRWTPGFVTDLQAAWTAFAAALTTAINVWGTSSQGVNISYYAGFTNFTYPSGRIRAIPTRRGTPLIDLVSNYVVSNKIGSQRRRNLQSS